MTMPLPLVLASWSVSPVELAILAGIPALVCVSLFMLTIGAITRDRRKDRNRHG